MCQSQYEGIVKVCSFNRVAGVEGAEDVVNELLKQGWVLLDEKIVTNVYEDGSTSVSVTYVVGRREEKKE